MAQSLLIGLGGTGSRIVNNVVKELKRKHKPFNDGEICCAVLDTDGNDNDLLSKSGTDVPIFGTSKSQRIKDYFNQYAHLHIEDWCPRDASFDEQSMLDGASAVRSKSRLAFFDSLETGKMRQLELMINKVLQNNDGSKIRVMIVSSLSGGTGSGMFIQVALWLRKILAKSQIVIRGIFLMPDVFIDTISDIRESAESKSRQYTNAYAALRELNTISRIKKSGLDNLENPITLDSLFDSRKDAKSGSPVFDFAFFIDNQDENGIRLGNIEEYEQMVAQLVYMQLYAPMDNSMYSAEDNMFLPFTKNTEPLYGSCGTAEAVYPFTSVINYCAIRAASDALKNGWNRLDGEIEAMEEERRLAMKDGYAPTDSIDVPTKYIQLFEEKASVKPEHAGKDRFFLLVGRDTMNEKKERDINGTYKTKYTDKITDFLELLKKEKIDPCVVLRGKLDGLKKNPEEFVKKDRTRADLEAMFQNDFDDLEIGMSDFTNYAEQYASTIVNAVFPFGMGDVTPLNLCSVYGLLSKKSENSADASFVHPVAARYLLYKLCCALKEGKDIVIQDSKYSALSDYADDGELDNPRTRKTETTFKEALDSVRRPKRPESFDDLEGRYVQFFNKRVDLAIKYETELLTVRVYEKLLARIEKLLEYLTIFFRQLEWMQEELLKQLENNISETKETHGKTIYVYAKPEDKEQLYNSLDLSAGENNASINRSVIEAVYGRYCADVRPSDTNNAPYLKGGIIANCIDEINQTYRDEVLKKANRELIDFDLYTAVCKESDSGYAEQKKKQYDDATQPEESSYYDFEEGRVVESFDAAKRHENAFRNLLDRLKRSAAPFLIRDTEIAQNAQGIKTSTDMCFWGFHPNIAKACPELGNILHINVAQQANSAYAQNALHCYRAVYGLEIKYIPKFNESSNGIYYTNYRSTIEEMTREAAGKAGESAYVMTPHLDKRWHRYLQYSSVEMNQQASLDLFNGLWLAIAYDRLRVNKEGHFVIWRKVDSGFQSFIDTEQLLLDGDKPIEKKQVLKLLKALRTDSQFLTHDVPKLKTQFAEELDSMDVYYRADVLKGLLEKKNDLNPVILVCRYSESRNMNPADLAKLIGALEHIASQVADHSNTQRGSDKLELIKYRICKKIYDSATRKSKDTVFGSWADAFKRCKIASSDIAEE